MCTEAQYKTTYNISIIALEEAKGTLLEYDEIAIVDGRQPKAESAHALVSRSVPVAPSPIQPVVSPPTAPTPARVTADESRPTAASPKPDSSAGKTYSFDFTFGIGSAPVQIRGSFTVTPVKSADAPTTR
jgi:hypothetical protein